MKELLGNLIITLVLILGLGMIIVPKQPVA